MVRCLTEPNLERAIEHPERASEPRIARRRAEEERADTSLVCEGRRSRRIQSAIRSERSEQLNTEPIIWLTIFVLAVFVGVEVISKVSSTLHTPLMSGANAIHGVILIGAILAAGTAQSTPILVLGLVAVILASINMVGGFVVTDRMLIMFSRPRRALEKQVRRELDQ
jgi:proton-translocating NAD(P)+ transhydrogenase subunit alpha